MNLVMDKTINLADLKQKYTDAGIELKSEESFLALDGYIGEDGLFDYEKYVKTQTALNKGKLGQNGPLLSNEEGFLVQFAKHNTEPIKFGLCHGTRRGTEQESLSEKFNIDVIGTEISETASQFPKTIEWDFHDIKEEWVDNTSIIYSNSFDHAFDPIYALGNWMRCIHKTGFIYLTAFVDGYTPGRLVQRTWEDWTESEKYGIKGYKLADMHGFTAESVVKMVEYNHNQGVIDINEWTITYCPVSIILWRGQEKDLKLDWEGFKTKFG